MLWRNLRIYLRNTVLHLGHGLEELSLCVTAALELCFSQKVSGHRYESILGPGLEPVHGTAGYQARELEGATAELFADRREAEDHMQIVLDLKLIEYSSCSA